jgi:hypothetical protein
MHKPNAALNNLPLSMVSFARAGLWLSKSGYQVNPGERAVH